MLKQPLQCCVKKGTRSNLFCSIVLGGLLMASWVAFGADPPASWCERVAGLRWVAYSPTHSDPNRGIPPSVEILKADLSVLRKANFNGLVTYSCGGPLGTKFVELAKEAGFKGIIVGIWDIGSDEELAAAKVVSNNPIVVGYCIGNEGYPARYNLEKLRAALQRLQEATGKPVSTSQPFHDYANDELLTLGDWVFPNVHPYFQNLLEPDRAVAWTLEAYRDLSHRTKKFVWFKEVGLPTAGDKENRLSEKGQEDYYMALAKTVVRFVYFEGFDLTWKTDLPVEPHWGIFHSDRTPKPLATRLMEQNNAGVTLQQLPTTGGVGSGAKINSGSPFYVYLDFLSRSNSFTPSGLMGDCGDIKVDQNCTLLPHSGSSCIKCVYLAAGNGPHTCNYSPPCKWAGIYWQEPANNWGNDKENKDEGYDLSAFSRLVFWGRADEKCKIDFKVGGISGPYGDSLNVAREKTVRLGKEWQEVTIDLTGADLSHIIGGFVWTATLEANQRGATFYLDDIRFEAK